MTKTTFLGGAGSVTGSKYLLEANGKRLLIDCGLFQGIKDLRQRNWDRFAVDPRSIDWVVLTHAHIDHIGYLPRLVRDGFRGPIYATAATCELAQLLLPDSAHLQEEDAAYAAEKGFSKHDPPLPLYTVAEAQDALGKFRPVSRRDSFAISSEFAVQPYDAGHILGSSILQITVTESGKSIVVVFSGDLGRYQQPILNDPQPVARADYLLCESTYGDRDHGAEPVGDQLAGIINRVSGRGGMIVIPAFAVGRTQELMYILRKLELSHRIPHLPVFVDSPMAIDVTALYLSHPEDHCPSFAAEEKQGDPLNAHQVHMTRTVEESKQINTLRTPAIIISASGMATGGRILHHLEQRLPDPRNAVLLVGYQAEGTRGRLLLEGAKTLRVHGHDVPVRAEIVELKQLSAHAGQSEILRWLGGFTTPPRQLFLIHGEAGPRNALREAIDQKLHWQVTAPAYGEAYDL